MKTITSLTNALQAGEVRRYHTEVVLLQQTVAQHSLNIQLILIWLYGEAPPAALLCAAAMHDLGERWTGDMPAPTKRSDPEMKRKMDDLERSAVLTHLIPVWLPPLTAGEEWTLKFADCAEGALFCLREVRMGNVTVRHVLRNYVTYIEGLVLSCQAQGGVSFRAHELMTYLVQESAA